MAVLKKKVNVYPKRPLFFGSFEIRGNKKNIELSVGNIYNSLLSGARIEEVLEDGSIVLLNISNYNKDNSVQSTPVATAARTTTEAKKTTTSEVKENVATEAKTTVVSEGEESKLSGSFKTTKNKETDKK